MKRSAQNQLTRNIESVLEQEDIAADKDKNEAVGTDGPSGFVFLQRNSQPRYFAETS